MDYYFTLQTFSLSVNANLDGDNGWGETFLPTQLPLSSKLSTASPLGLGSLSRHFSAQFE